ncbi:MAG TPA: SIS domain-containing protein [Symbiobacteriaceae bacterium]|nr:SIS domain-containing protein [Symbiobacteriaceae bacterium]
MTPLTLSEILRQPATWQQAVDVTAALPPFPQADQYIFTGCGTSYYLAIAAARFFQEFTGRPAQPVPASELILSSATYAAPGRTALVGFSRSGETTETLVALRRHTRGPVVSITCRADSAMSNMGDLTVVLPAADDRSVVMTSSFTTMLFASLLLGGRRDVGALPSALGAQLEDLRRRGEALGRDLSITQFIFLGMGPFYGLACEAMLKLKEMTQVPCEAYSPLEFRHGPISVVGPGTLVVLLGSERARAQEQDVLRDVAALGARTLALTPARDQSEAASGLLAMPLLQSLAYYRAMALGKDPDRPQHLTQVVTLDPSSLG